MYRSLRSRRPLWASSWFLPFCSHESILRTLPAHQSSLISNRSPSHHPRELSCRSVVSLVSVELCAYHQRTLLTASVTADKSQGLARQSSRPVAERTCRQCAGHMRSSTLTFKGLLCCLAVRCFLRSPASLLLLPQPALPRFPASCFRRTHSGQSRARSTAVGLVLASTRQPQQSHVPDLCPLLHRVNLKNTNLRRFSWHT